MIRSGLVLGLTLMITFGCRTERGRALAPSRPAAASAPAASGRAAVDAERVRRWVAARDRQHLLEEWEMTKEVLLADLKGRDLQARDAACALIALGQEECVPAMIASLKAHGIIQIAEAYLNSGHAGLSEAAAAWICEHGWMAETRRGMAPVTWGSMDPAATRPGPKPALAVIDMQPGFDRDAMTKEEATRRKAIEDALPKTRLREAAVRQAMEPGTVTVTNPNRCAAAVALRSKRDDATGIYAYGKDFGVAPGSSRSIGVCLGEFDVYFAYAADPTALFRGDSFKLSEGKQCDCEATIILPP